MSAFTVILFFGGWLPISIYLTFIPNSIWFSLKTMLVVSFFILVRIAYPRYRYDQLMSLGWKVFLPLSLGFFFYILQLFFLLR
jgi:NADH-quinone oxidoreductase subunit H